MKSHYLVLAVVVFSFSPVGRFTTIADEAAPDHAAEVRTAVQGLGSADADTRLQAKLQLLRPEAGPWLKGHSSEIITALQSDWENDESARLLGRLDLPADLAGRLRNSPHVPDAVRARLGDSQAEQRVISAFENAQGFGARHDAAANLAYVESPDSLAAFARGLASRDVIQDVHGNDVSVALLLIQAYGNMHPEEPLFSSSAYMKHANVTPVDFLQPEHQAYLRQLEARLLALNHIHVSINPPFLLNTDKVEKYR